jgi:hypothetical protein
MMLRGFVVVAACSAACGDVKDNTKLPDAPVQQDGAVADADVDAPDIDAPPPRCDPSKPFGAPTEVTELNSGANDYTPALSPDERTITFSSSRAGGVGQSDAYIATRSSSTGTFGPPILIPGVNRTTQDNRPMITADGLRLYLETNLTGQVADWETAVATRSSTAVNFGAWSAIPQINSTTTDTAAFILPDDSAIYFISSRGTGREIWRSAHAGGNWTTPTVVMGTNLHEATIDYMFLTPDELVLYLTSSRTGGAGGTDIWMATRATTAVNFDTPINIAALNTASPESGGWVSADNCVIYFGRNVGAAASNINIYRAEKPL